MPALPGPWKVERGQGAKSALLVRAANGRTVGMIFERDPILQNDAEAVANAELAAAAPTLRDALLAVLIATDRNARNKAEFDAQAVLLRLAEMVGHD